VAGPAVQRRRVPVVARGPVALRDLVAQVGAAAVPGGAQEPLRPHPQLVRIAVGGHGHDGLDRVRLRDVRLVVAPQVVELPLVEQDDRSEEHTSELQSLAYLVCRLLLEKKKKKKKKKYYKI